MSVQDSECRRFEQTFGWVFLRPILAQDRPRIFFFRGFWKVWNFFFGRFVLIASGTEIFWRGYLKFNFLWKHRVSIVTGVSLDGARLVNITFCQRFFCSRYMTKHVSHTCGRRCCRPAWYLSSSTHSHISERCLATALRVSSSITTGHYVLNKNVDPKCLGSKNNAMKEAQQAHTKWHRWHRCSSTCSSSKLCL